ncbi:hypothetical protein TWF730_009829 [Orbilia blumenaviensis]|uniref:Protein kinase domain-containing protein n=1 Tax=Orbilia blumenaviensis TaxID=1796055 RepID=A0AAV9UVD8_9PEZI
MAHCECNACVQAQSNTIFIATIEAPNESKHFFESIKSLILESYLLSFAWLIANRIPWYILYLLHNGTKDIVNASTEDSLGRFRIESLGLQTRPANGPFEIMSCIGGVKCKLTINGGDWQSSKTGILGAGRYASLKASHPHYFMNSILCGHLEPQIFRVSSSLPILADARQLNRGAGQDHLGGEAELFLINTIATSNDSSRYPSLVPPQNSSFKKYPFVLKMFYDSNLGVRELCAVTEALKITRNQGEQLSSRSILAPICAFLYGERFCIIYPRAVCNFRDFIKGTYSPTQPGDIPIPKVDIWPQLAKVAAVLEELHAKKNYHLDLTSQNLLVMDNGDLVISDFGEMGVPRSPSYDTLLKTFTKPGSPDDFFECRLGNPRANSLHTDWEARSKRGGRREYETKDFFQKSFDLYSFGAICFETVVYTIPHLEKYQSKLDIDQICQSSKLRYRDPSIRIGALLRWSDTRTLENEKIVGRVLKKLASVSSRFFLNLKTLGGFKTREESIDYVEIASIIRNLLNPASDVRVNQGTGLGEQLLQCLSRQPIGGPMVLKSKQKASNTVKNCFLVLFKRYKQIQTKLVPTRELCPDPVVPTESSPESKSIIVETDTIIYDYPSVPSWMPFLYRRLSKSLRPVEVFSSLTDGESNQRSYPSFFVNPIKGEIQNPTGDYRMEFQDGRIVRCDFFRPSDTLPSQTRVKKRSFRKMTTTATEIISYAREV